jgi:hypothetical protein
MPHSPVCGMSVSGENSLQWSTAVDDLALPHNPKHSGMMLYTLGFATTSARRTLRGAAGFIETMGCLLVSNLTVIGSRSLH